jgi:DNA helicase-2/ATP-dependent DNA helicase PcrA
VKKATKGKEQPDEAIYLLPGAMRKTAGLSHKAKQNAAAFKAEYIKLNAQQKQAVDTIDGPVLVIAGPGTGKTQLLSLRVANILRRTDINPGNILCLTFTEAGKEAMLNRLAGLIGKEAKKIEINTFHGFGVRLFTRFPEFFPELSKFRSADDLSLYEALNACLSRLPRNNPLSKQAYGEFVYQTDAKERISQLKRAGVLPEAALHKAQADINWCKSAGRKLTLAFNKAGRLSPKTAALLASQVPLLVKASSGSVLGKICHYELSEAINDLNTSGKTASLTAFKKKWFNTEQGKLYLKPADQLKKLLALAELYQDYETELKKRGLYDYDDMILYALEKLKNNSQFLAQVQETFQYILADEYQDTNAAQASIINLIADSPANEGRPNVMVVGDDDQAIYGFQGALGDVLMDFRERWRNVTVITLKDNYRSTPSILSVARAAILQGQNRLENYYEDIDKSLNARAGYADLAPIQFEAASPAAALDKAVVTAKSHGRDKQLAIISNKHKYLVELADRLDAQKIEYYYEGREDLLRDPHIVKLLLLCGLALSVAQKDFAPSNHVLPEIIASGLLDIPRPVAWQIALQAKRSGKSWWEVMSSLDHAQAKTAATAINSLVKALEPKDALSSLKTIAGQQHLRAVLKIRRLYQHATDYYGQSNITLEKLLRYTDLCKQARVTLEHTVIKGNEKARVVLLSAHRSKGQEFERVYILHADYRTWFKERGQNSKLGLPEGWKYIEPPATNIDDKLRLLYVAMTRAKQELAFIKSAGTQQLPGTEDMRIQQHIAEKVGEANMPDDQLWHTWYLPKTDSEKKQLKQLLEPELKNYKLSPTHLTTFLDVPRGGPYRFFVKIILGIAEPVNPEAVFGNYVHRTLRFSQEHLNTAGKLPVKAELENFVRSELEVASDNYASDIVDTVDGFLNHTSVLMPGGVAEYNFDGKHIPYGNMRLTGTVDHFVDKDSKLVVTDFKTGRALNSWKISEDYYKQRLHKFRQQLMFYELLFRNSPQFGKVQQIVSGVAFVEPSMRNVYCHLTLDANKKERDKLESLISAVWQKVITLDLPDVSAYGQDMRGTLDFEDQLIAGEI